MDRSIVLIVLSIGIASSLYNNSLYFDEADFFHADCVVKGSVYFYYGNRSVTARGNECENWSDIMDYHNQLFRGYNQFFFPDEYGDHRHCRQIFLDDYERVPSMNNASAHHYVQLADGWREGPWCYVKVPDGKPKTSLWDGRFLSDYRPEACFPKCPGSGKAERI